MLATWRSHLSPGYRVCCPDSSGALRYFQCLHCITVFRTLDQLNETYAVDSVRRRGQHRRRHQRLRGAKPPLMRVQVFLVRSVATCSGLSQKRTSSSSLVIKHTSLTCTTVLDECDRGYMYYITCDRVEQLYCWVSPIEGHTARALDLVS